MLTTPGPFLQNNFIVIFDIEDNCMAHYNKGMKKLQTKIFIEDLVFMRKKDDKECPVSFEYHKGFMIKVKINEDEEIYFEYSQIAYNLFEAMIKENFEKSFKIIEGIIGK